MSVVVPPDSNSAFLDDERKLVDQSRSWTRAVTRRVSNDEWTDVTFENSWVNFGSGFNDAQFRQLGVEHVEIRGLVKDGTVSTNIFTLPAELRPIANYGYAVVSNNAFGHVVVRSDGGVRLNIGSNVSVFLDGIIFSLD